MKKVHRKQNGHRRHLRAAAAFACLMLLCGFSFGEVRLKTDRPMIDLKETVQYSVIGDEDTMTDGEGEDAETAEDEKEMKAAVIRVREKRFYLNDVLQSGVPAIRQQLKASGAQVTLVDDYADYESYREIRQMLQDASIPYTEETLSGQTDADSGIGDPAPAKAEGRG